MGNLKIIKDLCKERGMTQAELAEKAGISLRGIQTILSENSTKIETLEKIADVLKVNVSIFFTNPEFNIYRKAKKREIEETLLKALEEIKLL